MEKICFKSFRILIVSSTFGKKNFFDTTSLSLSRPKIRFSWRDTRSRLLANPSLRVNFIVANQQRRGAVRRFWGQKLAIKMQLIRNYKIHTQKIGHIYEVTAPFRQFLSLVRRFLPKKVVNYGKLIFLSFTIKTN